MKRIILHIGAIKSSIQLLNFVKNNALFLQKNNIIAPEEFKFVEIDHFITQDGFYKNFDPSPFLKKYPKKNQNPIHALEHYIKKFDGILLSTYAYYRYLSVVREIRAKLKNTFPHIPPYAFLTLARQDLEIESHVTLLNLYPADNTINNIISHHKQKVFSYNDTIDNTIKIFGHKNTVIDIHQNLPIHDEHTITKLLSIFSIDFLQYSSLMDDLPPPPYTLQLPREFLAFAKAANVSGENIFCIPSLLPWSTQAHRFTPESGYASDGHSLLGPKRRTDILSHYAPSNAVLAKRLGMERLFPEPAPEPDWEPFLGLTPELAFKVAARLEPDFARARLEELDAAQTYYLTREQRTCRNALHDALDPAPALPALRARPEPAPPKVSVLTLTYNHAAFIEKTIQSVLEQRVNFPIQHIIADDGSEDGTQDIILRYAEKHPHIVPVFQRQRSYGSGNIYALFDMARSPYVALCDGDDYFTDPDKLQIQADFMDAHPDCALCFHPVLVTYEDDPGRKRVYPPVEELPRGVRQFYYLSDLIKCNLIQTNSVMYRWRFKDGLPDWFRTDLMPGDWYWHLLHAETGKIGFINKVMSVYRRHKESVYYLSEVDRLKHRYTVGKSELEAYDAVNAHFGHRFEPIILDLTNGVFADCLFYCDKIGDNSLLEELVDKYPRFAKHFLASLKIVSGKKSSPPS